MTQNQLQDFWGLLGTLDYEEFGQMRLKSAVWEQDDLIVTFDVAVQAQPLQRWKIRFTDIRDSSIAFSEYFADLALKSQHVLLMPYVEDHVDLFFNGTIQNAHEVAGQLAEAHRNLTADWFDLSHFLNVSGTQSIVTLLQGGYGKLGEGPKPLLDAYRDVLEGCCGVSVSKATHRRPLWYDGSMYVEEVGPFYATIWGKSYVVSKGVEAQQVS